MILDEIGRGTSSHDGSALAESIVNYIKDHVGSHSLFATHYHELTDVFQKEGLIKNIHMGYSEFEGRIVFTYKIKEGPSQKSYGIEVARLAGLPLKVIERARQSEVSTGQFQSDLASLGSTPSQQLELGFETKQERRASQKVMDELANLNPSEITPLEALTKITKWQDSYL